VPRPAWARAPFRGLGCLLAVVVVFTSGAGRGLGGAEGVGDALVGGVSLPVDAVGVDLQQDGDAVPGAAGDLGRGHTGVQPQTPTRCPSAGRGWPRGCGECAEQDGREVRCTFQRGGDDVGQIGVAGDASRPDTDE
jgi:hypothetical protein